MLPIAYRLWQEKGITSGQHGCRQDHSTSDALLRLAAELENASLTGDPKYGAALDFAKAFDNVPVYIALNLLERLGINERSLKPLTFMYQKLQRYFFNLWFHRESLPRNQQDNAGVNALLAPIERACLGPFEKCSRARSHRHAELCRRHNDPYQESGVVENSVPCVGALSSSYGSEAERY